MSTAARDRVEDLTRIFRHGFPVSVPGAPPPSRSTGPTPATHGYWAQDWVLHEHTGTHVDAPVHFAPGGLDVAAIPPEHLVLALRVVDISPAARADPDALLGPGDLVAHEREHGRIPAGALVALRSGWDERSDSTGEYLNTGADGVAHSPGFAPAAATELLDRGVRAIATDTCSLDAGASTDAPVHRLWLGAGHYGVEGLTRLGRVPPAGATAVVGVVPWESGSGGPCRVLAMW